MMHILKRKEAQHATRVVIKKANVQAVAKGSEIGLLLSILPEEQRCALLLICPLIARPAEVVDASLQQFRQTEKGTVLDWTHEVYKPRNRIYENSNTVFYKQIIKPVAEWSPYTSSVLRNYFNGGIFYKNQKLFPWSTSDSFTTRVFTRLRREYQAGKLPAAFSFLAEKITETIKGASHAQYRVSAYSLRRTAATFHYHVTFNRDIAALRDAMGHEHAATTIQYVMPAHSIGLTPEMIERRISFDEFCGLSFQDQLVKKKHASTRTHDLLLFEACRRNR